ncbi:MAG: UbiA family prenyltransferase [Gemmataceae bacterium]|nr:UbiA family prenyltransferase [Gemmataceae bacterium]
MSQPAADNAVSTAAPPAAHPFSWLAYAQLVRLPNVFTALADIGLAALVTGALPGQLIAFVLLLLASSCLYCSGMVWNDYFDLEQDKRERPFRPLPAGRISLRAAAGLATCLMLAGLGCAALVGALGDAYRPAPLIIAGLLALTILAYDAGLKRTWAGPIAMGACRSLNVLLGLSVMPGTFGAWWFLLAAVVGVYIAGVTWFAHTEARTSNQTQLFAAAAVMLLGLLLALALPVVGPRTSLPEEPTLMDSLWVVPGQVLFPYLLVLFGFYVGIPVWNAINRPTPERVQPAVKRAVLGLVLLDSILAAGLVGTVGLVLVVLLLPASYLGCWLYST